MKVVFDTNVLISSLFWKGAPRRAIDLAVDNQVQSVTSLDILDELQAVLLQDFQIPLIKVKDVLRDILSYSQLVKPEMVHLKIRDLDDIKIICTAQAAKVDYIVTGDKDLLIIKQFRAIKIITPSEFMRLFDSL
jgi:putative PIN family toxin of toxin-antitoxin system